MERLRKRFLKPIEVSVKPTPTAEWDIIKQKVIKAVAEAKITDQQLSAQDYFERALALPQENIDGKIADYTQAITLDPTFVNAFYNRGIMQTHRHNYEL